MKAIYKVNYHSLIDVITNSSSELFVTADNKIIEFIKVLYPDSNFDGSMFKLTTVKEYIANNYTDDETPASWIKDLNPDDELLECRLDSEDMNWQVSEFVEEKLNFKRVY